MRRRKMILVPVDSSAASRAVLPYAEAFARALGQGLLLFTAVSGARQEPAPSQPDGDHEAERRALAYLADLGASSEHRGIEIASRAVRGDAARTILTAAEDDDIGMLAMATHGRGAVGRWILGSVADKVMRMSSKPTLLIRPPEVPPRDATVSLRRLLVPLDGSALAETALQAATELAEATRAAITVIRVIPSLRMEYSGEDIDVDPGALTQQFAESIDAYVKGVKGTLPPDIEAEAIVAYGPVAATLEDAIKGRQIDLVVLTTHGRSGMPRFVLGSTADRLIRAGVPALLLHPKPVEPTGFLAPASAETGRTG